MASANPAAKNSIKALPCRLSFSLMSGFVDRFLSEENDSFQALARLS
jgi:hypothetical protein